MWDALITAGNLVIVPSLIPTVLHKRAYVPRATSGLTVIGLSIVFAGVLGAELYLSAIALSGIWTLWVFIFLLRGDERKAERARREAELARGPAPEPTD